MRPESLKNKSDFDRAFNNGIRYQGELLTAIIAKGLGTTKLGIIVNCKFGGAVARNKVKRLIREAFRDMKGKIHNTAEFVIIPKGKAEKAKTQEILKDLSNIIRRADIK